MRRVLFAAVLAVLAGAAVSEAQERVPERPVQPVRPAVAAPARVAALEEEVELLEAQRDVRKAHIRATEVGVEATKSRFDLLAKGAGAGISATEVLAARFEFELAKAQLDIRLAEFKEVEVKIKHAKKRLEEAKAAGVRPGPVPGGGRPLPNAQFSALVEKVAEAEVRAAKLDQERVELALELARLKQKLKEIEK